MFTAIHATLSKNASDDFAFKSSLHTIGCLSRTQKTSTCWATNINSISTGEIFEFHEEGTWLEQSILGA